MKREINVNFGNLLDNVKIPKMYAVRQRFEEQKIENVVDETKKQLKKAFGEADFTGKKIAVTAGSRGISHSVEILCIILGFLKEKGADPFIVPAMGSHGGATMKGQIDVLSHLGITPESMNVPFEPSMETVELGTLTCGLPVYFSKVAYEADGVFIMNKVKPHADFKGEHESGLVKMLAIGLGKHKGCASLHKLGFANFSWALPEAAKLILEKAPIIGGIGIVENAYDEPVVLEAVPAERIIERDKELLKLAKNNMSKIKVKQLDVLIIDEIGKNISGEGMDPNVTGRPGSYLNEGFDSIQIKQIVILGTTPETAGNGAGIGMADITTVDCVRDLDLGVMYTNSITAGILGPSRLPVILNSDLEAIKTAIMLSSSLDTNKARVMRIKNTLSLDEVWISETLKQEYEQMEDAEVIGQVELSFDTDGRMNKSFLG